MNGSLRERSEGSDIDVIPGFTWGVCLHCGLGDEMRPLTRHWDSRMWCFTCLPVAAPAPLLYKRRRVALMDFLASRRHGTCCKGYRGDDAECKTCGETFFFPALDRRDRQQVCDHCLHRRRYPNEV